MICWVVVHVFFLLSQDIYIFFFFGVGGVGMGDGYWGKGKIRLDFFSGHTWILTVVFAKVYISSNKNILFQYFKKNTLHMPILLFIPSLKFIRFKHSTIIFCSKWRLCEKQYPRPKYIILWQFVLGNDILSWVVYTRVHPFTLLHA